MSSVENSNSFVSECLELNQFIFVNQEALRKIIKKHDKNLSGTTYSPINYLLTTILNFLLTHILTYSRRYSISLHMEMEDGLPPSPARYWCVDALFKGE